MTINPTPEITAELNRQWLRFLLTGSTRPANDFWRLPDVTDVGEITQANIEEHMRRVYESGADPSRVELSFAAFMRRHP